MNKFLFFILFFAGFSFANQSVLNEFNNSETSLSNFQNNANDAKSPQEAFSLDFFIKDQKVHFIWQIAKNHYLYKEKIAIFIAGNKQVIDFKSKPNKINDQFFGNSLVFKEQLELSVEFKNNNKNKVYIVYQGCFAGKLCYQNIYKELDLKTKKIKILSNINSFEKLAFNEPPKKNQNQLTSLKSINSTTTIDYFLKNNFILAFVFLFLIGIVLTFSPCSLPLLPILSSYILSNKSLSRKKNFKISFFYIQGMAFVYSLIGILVSFLGIKFNAFLQNSCVLFIFSLLIFYFALSFFGVFKFNFLKNKTNKITALQDRVKSRNIFESFYLGALASLIASPCISAPLATILVYIASANNIYLGAFYLYVLALGIGTPLILVATFGIDRVKKIKPIYFNFINKLFGFVLIGLGISFLARSNLIFDILIFLSYITLICSSFFYLYKNHYLKNKLLKIFTIILAIASLSYFILQFNKQANLNTDIFIKFTNQSEFEKILQNPQKKLVVLDFYANWCSVCKSMERDFFSDKEILKAMENVYIIKVDLSEISQEEEKLLKKYNILGTPSFLFFKNTNELRNHRQVGSFDKKHFLYLISNL